ncbi:hypothetical protein SBI_02809 [Streptomyces bingchenggensis BCW-1]|uniref:Uncharacterized protein n=1 Tax=Streptomyces bingchenggensis (strain BCW-1) TaxID=749414 RepID=D7C2P7_STRBB|nr:hypothetical protein SBI_02809 [Streptomyces bingchenggensis BCW-1]
MMTVAVPREPSVGIVRVVVARPPMRRRNDAGPGCNRPRSKRMRLTSAPEAGAMRRYWPKVTASQPEYQPRSGS